MKSIRRPFLTARWSNLAIFTWEVPPAGLELDRRGGAAFASLVAFDFLDTHVWGVAWPGVRTFPEINLRFYVRHGERRGVVFIREYVPSPLVAWAARAIYNEPYLVAPIESTVAGDGPAIATIRRLHWQGRSHALEVTGSKPAFRPTEASDEHFFKEHQWGFGRDRRGRTQVYEVRHPLWDVYPVRSSSVDLDCAQVCGGSWSFLSSEKPASVVLAAGSAVSVYPRRRL
jgi:uncharacterized protein YqjF (DUF2071 family)